MDHCEDVQKLLAQAGQMWRPPPDLTVSEWADAHRVLSPESSSEPGQWHTDRTPYLRGPMDAISDPTVSEVVLMFASQVGKTEVLNNIAGYYIHQEPSPILVIQPTLEMAKTWSKDRLAPMLRDSPVFDGLIRDPRARDSDNTVFHKAFPGGHITVTGANSAAGLASRPIRVLLFDEVDRYPASAGTEGDPVTLARKRTATFWNRKIVMVSSPTREGASRIEQARERSDKRMYFVPCPHCGHEQVLQWSHVRWPDGEPEKAHMVCQECAVVLDDSDRVRMVQKGEWRATAPFRGIAGYWLSGLYSLWQSLAAIVQDFLDAKKFPDTLMAWTNTTLAELWKERGEFAQSEALAARAEDYPLGFVPAGGLLLTAGVDVQHDRLAVQLVAYGEREEAWVVGWEEIYGSPASHELWERLDAFLERDFAHESGGVLRVAAICVDEGDGVTTSYVRDYCRVKHNRPIPRLNTKGASQATKRLLGKSDGKKRENKPWMVDVNTIKGLLLPRLKMADPIMVHFSSELPADYYKQITAESLVRRLHKGFPRMEWVKDPKVNNEGLDTFVLSYAAALYAGLKTMRWGQRKSAVESTKPTPKMEAPVPMVPQHMIAPRRRGGFATGWK